MIKRLSSHRIWRIIFWCGLVFASSVPASSERLDSLTPIWTLDEDSLIRKAKISQTGNSIIYITNERSASPGSGLVILRNIPTGKPLCVWDTQGTAIDASFSPRGNEVVLVLSQSRPKHSLPGNLGNINDYAINTYNVDTCNPIENFRIQSYRVRSVSYSDDGEYLVGTKLPRVFIVRLDEPEKVQWISPNPRRDVRWLQMFKDYRGFLALETSPGFITIYNTLYDLRDRKRSQVSPRGSWPAAFTLIPDISTDGLRFLYATSIGTPYEWKKSHATVRDLKTLNQTHSWPIGEGINPRMLKFIPPSSNSVLSIYCDGILKVHKLQSTKVKLVGSLNIGICPNFETTGFSSEGTRLLVAGQDIQKGNTSRLSVFNTQEILDWLEL